MFPPAGPILSPMNPGGGQQPGTSAATLNQPSNNAATMQHTTIKGESTAPQEVGRQAEGKVGYRRFQIHEPIKMSLK